MGYTNHQNEKQLVGSTDDILFFWQLNLQHGKVSTAVLTENLARADNVVVLVQEPWVRDNKILGLNINQKAPQGGCGHRRQHAQLR